MGNRPLGLPSNEWARRQPEQRKIFNGRVAGANKLGLSSQFLELIPGQAASGKFASLPFVRLGRRLVLALADANTGSARQANTEGKDRSG